jgi:uncharacterized Zn finger protein (UPF0148 family)
MNAPTWIEFVPLHNGKVQCPICKKEIGALRIARGSHAAWHLKQRLQIEKMKEAVSAI